MVPSGLVIVDKPAGWTSHQVVGRMRRLAGTRKVGHAGTLDPMATGVLVIGVERATRLLGHLMLTSKTYTATIRLGVSTLTDDAEGDVTARTPVPELSVDEIETALEPLRGDILQVPTAVSAIKVNGVRSYARVRAGESVELAARPVRVARLEVVDRRDRSDEGSAVVDLDVEVDCSSGTYIRALARDLGAGLGVGGHLTALRRTRVGPYDLSRSRTIEQAEDDLGLIPIADAARVTFSSVDISEEQAIAVRYGRRLPGLALPDSPTALFDPVGDFLALYEPHGDEAKPVAVFTT